MMVLFIIYNPVRYSGWVIYLVYHSMRSEGNIPYDGTDAIFYKVASDYMRAGHPLMLIKV